MITHLGKKCTDLGLYSNVREFIDMKGFECDLAED
jgi:hypothetical protein